MCRAIFSFVTINIDCLAIDWDIFFVCDCLCVWLFVYAKLLYYTNSNRVENVCWRSNICVINIFCYSFTEFYRKIVLFSLSLSILYTCCTRTRAHTNALTHNSYHCIYLFTYFIYALHTLVFLFFSFVVFVTFSIWWFIVTIQQQFTMKCLLNACVRAYVCVQVWVRLIRRILIVHYLWLFNGFYV